MDAIQLLTQRQSCPRLTNPAPQGDDLNTILTAGNRAPDHGGLMPWRFVVCQGEGLDKLSDVFFEASTQRGDKKSKQEKAKNSPYRAPLIITVLSKIQESKKVPEIEQHLAAGCALMSMQQAAQALGFGGIWRTGKPAFDPMVRDFFELDACDQIIGFLYVGTPETELLLKPNKSLEGIVRYL